MTLATVTTIEREHPGGVFTDFDVIDSRSGNPLAIRGRAECAGQITDWLNEKYPTGPWPAYDTLIHEIVCARIGGEIE